MPTRVGWSVSIHSFVLVTINHHSLVGPTVPPALDHPKHGKERRRHQREQPAQNQLEHLRRPPARIVPVPAVPDPDRRQTPHARAKQEGKAQHGHGKSPDDLREEVQALAVQTAPPLALLFRQVQQQEPARRAPPGLARRGRLAEEANRLDVALAQVAVHNEHLDQPRYDSLHDDGHGCVAGQGIG